MAIRRGASGGCGRARGARGRSRHHRQCPNEPGSVSGSRSRQLHPQGRPAGFGRTHWRNGTHAQASCRRLEGCARGRRAVQDALPFLREAENVVIVEVSERAGDQASSRLRDVDNYLARHRVATVTERVLPVDATAANSLLRFIADENISLVAAGGYGHSRLGEWAYGGVTRDLLAESPVCCLFSH